MYQLTMHFTFYHELAHLIQNSEYLETYIYETPVEFKSFDLTKHRLELDADNFSGISIATQSQQYAIKQFGGDLDSKKMEALLVIFSSTLLIYLLSCTTTIEKLYYYENSHPHPIVRILNIILNIIHLLQHSPVLGKRDISLNHKVIFEETIKTAHIIQTEVTGTIKIENFEEIVKPEMPGIMKYLS